MAAKSSTRKDIANPNFLGMYSESAKPIPRLMGTPIKSAIAEVTMVPNISGKAPKTREIAGSHLVPKRKPNPKV
jgi:hypothetical protein